MRSVFAVFSRKMKSTTELPSNEANPKLIHIIRNILDTPITNNLSRSKTLSSQNQIRYDKTYA